MKTDFSGKCEPTPVFDPARELLSQDEETPSETDNRSAEMPPGPFTFQIFIDFRGMYRWLLLDGRGERVRQSRHGFAGLAGAYRDAEAFSTGDGYEPAEIAPPAFAR